MEHDPIVQQYLDSLVKLSEDDFTRLILKPLFQSMGYERVEFNGGSYERGRDLIAQRKIPPQTAPYVVYIQSKKIGNIQNTTEASKYTQLVHQLRQACEEPLTDMEGRTTKPNLVYLACPEQITTRFMDEVKGQLFSPNNEVYPLDGPEVIRYINEYKPELLNILLTDNDRIFLREKIEPGNIQLLSALKSDKKPSVHNFYNDLSFFVGSIDSNLLLHLELSINEDTLTVDELDWILIKNEVSRAKSKYNISLLNENIEELEEQFFKTKKTHNNKSNLKKIIGIKNKENEIDELNRKIEKSEKEISETLYTKKRIGRTKISEDNLKTMLDIFAYARKGNLSENDIDIYDEPLKRFAKIASSLNTLASKKNRLNSQLSALKSTTVPYPHYQISLNHTKIYDLIDTQRKTYFESIEKINNNEYRKHEVSSFLTNTERFLSFISYLQTLSSPISKRIKFSYNKKYQDRVSISPHDIFATGHDIALYGGAGVGKTTTLEEYAFLTHSNKTPLIFIQLNNIIDSLRKLTEPDQEETFFSNDLIIKIILLSKGFDVLDEKVVDTKKSLNQKFTLILDGLDEAYSSIPHLLSSIKEFKQEFSEVQLIVSSRDCVSYLKEIDFLGITLLPFTEKQLFNFIKLWLDDDAKSKSLIQAINSRGLYDYIKTPLLATITCSLVDKGIDAPSTENEIYSERIRLLTGDYDQYKNISRQKITANLLRKCASKIAFRMHKQKVRSAKKPTILSFLTNDLSSSHDAELLSQCLDELIDPCNVLVFNAITDTYSFGHFRFQEHLACEELASNRSLDIAELTVDDWWRGSLCLYAQQNEMFHIFDEVYTKYGTLKRSMITIKSMIENSPAKDKAKLYSLLSSARMADDLDEKVLPDFDDFDESYNIDDDTINSFY